MYKIQSKIQNVVKYFDKKRSFSFIFISSFSKNIYLFLKSPRNIFIKIYDYWFQSYEGNAENSACKVLLY